MCGRKEVFIIGLTVFTHLSINFICIQNVKEIKKIILNKEKKI